MSESGLLKKLMIAVSKTGARVFRNHVGLCWQGKGERCALTPHTVTLYPGDVLVRQARQVRAGLCVGSSDLIGWTPRVMTAADVGRTFAVFTAIEAKSEDGRLRTEQENFLYQVDKQGGIAIEARDVDATVAEIIQRRG